MINTLINNNYLLDLIFNTLNNRLKNLFHKKLYLLNNNENKNNSILTTKKENYFLVPYIEPLSKNINNIIKNKSSFKIYFRRINKLYNYIKLHKDEDKKDAQNNIIYKIECKSGQASYVGQTKRKLYTRINEHKKLQPSNITAVSEHVMDSNHIIDWENVKIVDKEPIFHKRRISEMLHIKLQPNALNKATDRVSR